MEISGDTILTCALTSHKPALPVPVILATDYPRAVSVSEDVTIN